MGCQSMVLILLGNYEDNDCRGSRCYLLLPLRRIVRWPEKKCTNSIKKKYIRYWYTYIYEIYSKKNTPKAISKNNYFFNNWFFF